LRALASARAVACSVLVTTLELTVGLLRDLAETRSRSFLSHRQRKLYGCYLCMAVPDSVEVFLERNVPLNRVFSGSYGRRVLRHSVAGSVSTRSALPPSLCVPIGLFPFAPRATYLLAFALSRLRACFRATGAPAAFRNLCLVLRSVLLPRWLQGSAFSGEMPGCC
jgi:hypothetical protein